VQVNSFVKRTLLDPLVMAKKISKEESKWVLAKAASKVLDHRDKSTEGIEPFLSKKRQAKIRDLVDKYVKQVLHDKKRKAVTN